ncbi:acyl-CoA dehydrogenase family protein [Sandarakinorhabdus sp.]|jgi:alkylation response protein AidB-like acyl-CoA dehydrogenase|uniref:acyl-CoA dehydrogenase family protein n=1 Tax=Sandarakinorhabdus sp. TaxID=1916663 RepID=UPI0033423086
MDFNFTEEQTMLRDTLSRYLADTYNFDARQKVVHGGKGWNPAVWQAFAEELGILGAPFSEAHGGLGGGVVENMVVMEEMGRAIVLEPYLSTVVIGGGALKHVGGGVADAVIPGIIGGTTRIAFAAYEPQGRYYLNDLTTTLKGGQLNGHKAVVDGAAHATHLLVTARTGGAQRDAGGIALLLIPADAPGITRRDYLTVHGTSASEVYFENVSIGADHVLREEALPLIEQVVDEATAALCAEACGVLRVLHASSLDYAKQRKQFGKAIGDFQVIQHRLVDMFMEVEQAVSMTMMATLKLDTDERAAAVSMAKAKVGKAAKFVGQNAVQIHGGIGITQELAVGHYFKRATLIENQFGSVDFHLSRYEGIALAA